MAVVYLALGSNLGNRRSYIENAIRLLKEKHLRVEKVSRIIETEPLGGLPQGKFLNAVLKATTDLSAFELLGVAQSIEKELGRERSVRNAPRTIDIDILLYDHQRITNPQLTIPHPRMFERDFVMIPLQEIEPDLILLRSILSC